MPIHRTTTGLQIAHSDYVRDRPLVKMAFGSPRAYSRRKPTSFRLDPLEATYKRLQASLEDPKTKDTEERDQRSVSRSSDSAMLAMSSCRPFHLPNDTSSQLQLIQQYNRKVQKRSKVPLPPVRISMKQSGRGKELLRRPLQHQFTDRDCQDMAAKKSDLKYNTVRKTSKSGVSIKAKNFVAANNPPEIQYRKERSSIILKPNPSVKQSKSVRMVKELNQSRSTFSYNKKNSITLPTVAVEKEADFGSVVAPYSTTAQDIYRQQYLDTANLEDSLVMQQLVQMTADLFTPMNSPVQSLVEGEELEDPFSPANTVSRRNSKAGSMFCNNSSFASGNTSKQATPSPQSQTKRMSTVTIGDDITLALPGSSRNHHIPHLSVSERNKSKAELLRHGSLHSPGIVPDAETHNLDRAEIAKIQRIQSARKGSRVLPENSDRSQIPRKIHKFSIGHPLYESKSKDQLDNADLDKLYDRGVFFKYLDTIKEDPEKLALARKYLGETSDIPPQPPPTVDTNCRRANLDGQNLDFRLVIEERRRSRDYSEERRNSTNRGLIRRYRPLPDINGAFSESEQSLDSGHYVSSSTYTSTCSTSSSGPSQHTLIDRISSVSHHTSGTVIDVENHRICMSDMPLKDPESETKVKPHKVDKSVNSEICLILEPTSPPPNTAASQDQGATEYRPSVSSTSSSLTHPEMDDIGSLPGSPYGAKMGFRRRSSSIDSCMSRPGSELLEVPMISMNPKDRVPVGADSPSESPSVSPTWSQISDDNHGDLQTQVVHRVSGPILEHIPVTPIQSPEDEEKDQEPKKKSSRSSLPEAGAPAVSLTTDDGDDFAVWFGRRGSIFIEEKQEEEKKKAQRLLTHTIMNEKGQISLAVPKPIDS